MTLSLFRSRPPARHALPADVEREERSVVDDLAALAPDEPQFVAVDPAFLADPVVAAAFLLARGNVAASADAARAHVRETLAEGWMRILALTDAGGAK